MYNTLSFLVICEILYPVIVAAQCVYVYNHFCHLKQVAITLSYIRVMSASALLVQLVSLNRQGHSTFNDFLFNLTFALSYVENQTYQAPK